MSPEMFEETILANKRRVPFKPFTIVVISGSRYEVDHPEAILVRSGSAIYMGPGHVPVFFDHYGVSEIIGDLSGRETEAA